MDRKHFALFSVLPVCMGVLMQGADVASGGNSEAQGARLVDPASGEVKAQNGENPHKRPSKGMLGDPIGFTCVAARRLEGFIRKATPDVITAEIGTIQFETVEGVKLTGRVLKHQKRTVEENGQIIGKGPLELTFDPAFSRSKGSVTITAEAQEWQDRMLNAWKTYRDTNRYPVVLLMKPSGGSATASANVED